MEDPAAVVVLGRRADRVVFILDSRYLLFGHNGDALGSHHPILNIVMGKLGG